MPESFDIAVIGGGISGVSLAARLAPDARVVLVEAESQLATQATGRSAALLVEAYGPPEMRTLTGMSRAFFEAPPAGFSEATLFRRRGGLVFGRDADLARLCEEFELARSSAPVVWLSADEVLAHCPLMRPGIAAAGFLEPDAGDIDADALVQGFARRARHHGARFLTGAPVRRIERQPDGWRVAAGEAVIACRIVVNAAGAWADAAARLAGVPPVGLQPMRRTAATIGVPDDLAVRLAGHPFVAPVDESFYFKPETAAIMVSLAEETPSEPCDAFADDIDVATALERFHAATIVPPARPIATWAGLRTFVADRRPVVGFDADAPGFFWYAGQGGYGIQTSPALSALAAKLLLGGRLDAAEEPVARAFRSDRLRAVAPEIGARNAESAAAATRN